MQQASTGTGLAVCPGRRAGAEVLSWRWLVIRTGRTVYLGGAVLKGVHCIACNVGQPNIFSRPCKGWRRLQVSVICRSNYAAEARESLGAKDLAEELDSLCGGKGIAQRA